MGQNDFLRKLVKNTLIQSDSEVTEDKSDQELFDYFQKKSNPQEQKSYAKWMSDIKCYRLVLNQKTIDFPCSWSLVQKLTKEHEISLNKKSDDKYFLLDFFNHLGFSISHLRIQIIPFEKIVFFFRLENDSNL